MNGYLRELAGKVRNDPAAMREMARLRRAEAGFPRVYSALSIMRHQVEMLEKHGLAIDFDPVTGLTSEGARLSEGAPLRKWTVEKAEARRRIARLQQNWEDAAENGLAAAVRQEAHTVAGNVAAESAGRGYGR